MLKEGKKCLERDVRTGLEKARSGDENSHRDTD